MYSRILVTLDGSSRSEAVVPHALAVAAGTGAGVTLLRVLEGNPSDWGERGAVGRAPAAMEAAPHTGQQSRDYLEKIAVELRRSGIVVQVDVREGFPAKQIVSAARDLEADVIAMATHSRRGLNRLMFGSVAEAVLHESAIPVLLVRS